MTKHHKNVLRAAVLRAPFPESGFTASACPPLLAERYAEMDVGSRPGVGANSYPDTSCDHSPATDRSTLPRTQTAALSAPAGLEQTATAPGVVLPVRRRQPNWSPTCRSIRELALLGTRESRSSGITRRSLANSRKSLSASDMHRRRRTGRG